MIEHFNPWHHIVPGHKLPDTFHAVVEIPKDSRAKYELDTEIGCLRLDRVLSSSVHYPANYGFIPQTYSDDKDPLDILILSQISIVPLCVVPVKIIGLMRITDDGVPEDKIIGVAAGDPSINHLGEIADLPPNSISELRSFFEDYKKLEFKKVLVEDFMDKASALDIIEQSLQRYRQQFSPDKQI